MPSLRTPPLSCTLTSSSTSGNASASPSNVVTSFLFGRRRLRVFFDEDFSIRETKAECLMVRLSDFELMKVEADEDSGYDREAVLELFGRGNGFDGLDVLAV